ncbi:MAG: hypothetical protein AAGE84_18955 [Cyanobacteria bacterium P01_G01_bin.39]
MIHRVWMIYIITFHQTLFLSLFSSFVLYLGKIQTGRCVHTCWGHTNWVRYVAVNLSNFAIASSSDDKTIKLWDIYFDF